MTGPFGVFTLREGRDSDLIFIGGGAGMAPILWLLRSLVERGISRKATYYYGARRAAGPVLREGVAALEETLPGFRYVPALSESTDGDGWEGEVGFITDVVRRQEGELADVDAYVCGPPPMVEAAIALLTDLGAPEKRIYYDKFTTTGETDSDSSNRKGVLMTTTTTQRDLPKPEFTDAEAGAQASSPTRTLDGSTTSRRRSANSRTTRTSRSKSSPILGTT